MTEGFDKEIDLLLRQTAQGETAATLNPKSKIQNPKSIHLDADEIAAFAENALPEKARLNYVAHFADCNRCRKILSNVIALNSDTQSEIIHAEEPKSLIASPKIPWYRTLFAVPTLAYTMGGLILLFAGFGVFTILQNDSKNSQVSQVSEKQIGGKGMSSDGESVTQEIYTNTTTNAAGTTAASNQMSANMTANAANTAAATNSSATTANANISPTLRREPVQNPAKDNKQNDALIGENKSAESRNPVIVGAPPPPPPAAMAAQDSDKETQIQPAPKPQRPVLLATPNARPEETPGRAAILRKGDNKTAEAKKKSESFSDATTIGGKTFKRANNVWVDSAYRGQTTINISRGTNDYKNLDSGLRGIVENLGGTVVIVWREKAFRIQ